MSDQLALAEQIIDTAGVTAQIEARLPVGVRPRQLSARTLLIAMTLAMLAGRDALLTNVHATLTGLPGDDQRRLGVIAQWKHAEHTLTYRQLEYTYRLIAKKLSKDPPDGSPSQLLSEIQDALLQASVTVLGEPASSSYAVDWTAHEAWSRPPPKPAAQAEPDTDTAAENTPPGAGQDQLPAGPTDPQPAPPAGDTHPEPAQPADAHQPDQPDRPDRRDTEASWGHRTVTHPSHTDMFYGYYLQALTIVKDEHGPDVPELARRMHLACPRHDPPAQIVPVIGRMHQDGIPISDLLADSGYSYRQPQTWALPIRALGIDLIMDLHPADRGPHGTHMGATCSNGNLYCPATPTTLLELSPLHRAASSEQTQAHDRQCAELARYKLSPITGYDPDGYRRVKCPAAHGKLRCPLRPQSMTLPHQHPTILTPPEHPPACCEQQTITVPPSVNSKTAQKHDWPSPQHRHSYNRRSGAERTFATTSDRARNDLSRGWCRLTGLTPIALFIATTLIARNIRIADAFTARQAENDRRAAHGLAPKQRKRRRQTLDDLAAAANAPPLEPAALAD